MFFSATAAIVIMLVLVFAIGQYSMTLADDGTSVSGVLLSISRSAEMLALGGLIFWILMMAVIFLLPERK